MRMIAMRFDRLDEHKPTLEWRVVRDQLLDHVRAFVPDGWAQPLRTFAHMPNFLPADLNAFGEHQAAGTLRRFLTEKYEGIPYGIHIIAAIERFYGNESK